MMNPRDMQKVLKQMNAKEIEAKEVLIRMKDGKELLVKKPQVIRMSMMGQDMFQVMGAAEVRERAETPAEETAGREGGEDKEISEEDISLVMEQTGATREKSEEALRNSKDIAGAILKLKKA